MPQFTRRTILAATDLIANWGHTEIDRLLLGYRLERAVAGSSRADKANALAKYLIANPDAQSEYGENLSDAIVEALVRKSIGESMDGYPAAFSFGLFTQRFAPLQRGLERDGFTVETGDLRRTLPQVLDLPRADDEVHGRLDMYGFVVAKGHLDHELPRTLAGNGPPPTGNSARLSKAFTIRFRNASPEERPCLPPAIRGRYGLRIGTRRFFSRT